MTTYKIVSPRIGKPGDPYTPEDGVNVEALVAGGFIAPDKKSNKPNSEKE